MIEVFAAFGVLLLVAVAGAMLLIDTFKDGEPYDVE